MVFAFTYLNYKPNSNCIAFWMCSKELYNNFYSCVKQTFTWDLTKCSLWNTVYKTLQVYKCKFLREMFTFLFTLPAPLWTGDSFCPIFSRNIFIIILCKVTFPDNIVLYLFVCFHWYKIFVFVIFYNIQW